MVSAALRFGVESDNILIWLAFHCALWLKNVSEILRMNFFWSPLRAKVGNDTFIPTLLNYMGVSWIQDQSPALLYGWPKLSLKRKFGSVARKKLRFKLNMFQNSKIIWLMLVLQFLASFSCVNAHYLLQTKRREFLLCYSYKNESLWMSIQPILKSLTDRLMFFPQNCLWGGGEGGRGGPNQKRTLGWGGYWSKKNLQIWDLQRLASLMI